jgi:MOSC domain-containing protein YiiM
VTVVGDLVSVNVALPRDVPWQGRTIRTSFFKEPRAGPVRVASEGLEGDQVGDPRVHGGPRKAVYAYSTEHYPSWSSELGVDPLPWGSFGENLSIRGVTEERVRTGDLLEIGNTLLEVIQPRTPCFKLNVRFGREDMVRRFAAAGRSGFYLGVRHGGRIAAGDPVVVRPGSVGGPTIRDQFLASVRRPMDPRAELADE